MSETVWRTNITELVATFKGTLHVMMTKTISGNVSYQRLRSLFEAGEYYECLRVFDSIESKRQLLPNELVQKGRCILLSSGDLATPEDAEAAYRRALELDSDYLPALLELGWFYYAPQDDASTALTFFDRALTLATDEAEEAAKGREKCLNELREDRIKEANDDALDTAEVVRTSVSPLARKQRTTDTDSN